MRYIRYFAKHQLLKGDKIVIASKEVLKDNRTVYPFVDSEMLKYADQVHTLKSEPKDVSFLETMRGVLENLPLLVIMSAYSGFVCWYGFHVGFLLKSNGVILSTFLAHLFMDCSIFLLHKTGILKHVIRKI